MKLYSYYRSSSAWRVRIALHYKGIPHELVPVHLLHEGGEQHRPDFEIVNPLRQVPVLELDDANDAEPGAPRFLSQSMAILEYLEERFPDPPLLPPAPALRARARQLAEMVNSGMQPFQNITLQNEVRGMGHDPLAFTRAFLLRGLGALARVAAETAGRFLVGDQPTFADAYLVPQLFGARRHHIDVEIFPLLRRVEQACEELPAFRAARPEAQPDAPREA